MIEGRRGFATAILAVVIGVLSPSIAAKTEAPEMGVMKLGYVELADDPRYANRGAHSGIVFTDLGPPYQGAQVALEDAQAIGRVIGVEFSMEKSTAISDDELVQRISDWNTTDGIHFVLADLPAAALKDLARRLADHPVLLFNISAPDDALRGVDCANKVLHTYPERGDAYGCFNAISRGQRVAADPRPAGTST
jgi:hypothetical protein